MKKIQDILNRFQKMAVPLASLFVLSYFGFHALHGKNGLPAHVELQKDIDALQAEYDSIHAVRTELESHIGLLNSENVDPDYLDELSRRYLGYSHQDEIIILENSTSS
ncbi:FtsB family cell division protein [Emcibacter nanhaiensis]|uniref:Septum formation initiator family protein n=1 Tax=Emcibacter nanhaiensis TaxID=1505037 RepID=A0A501PSJ7_9PROT|nr:septum formation initiator family protein [Emcibacter nanhaiensis]TPD63067.1 septum formation initiator family protein [Emcibacter nanhaiensis]